MYTMKNIYTSMTYLKVKKETCAIGIANMNAWDFRNPIKKKEKTTTTWLVKSKIHSKHF